MRKDGVALLPQQGGYNGAVRGGIGSNLFERYKSISVHLFRVASRTGWDRFVREEDDITEKDEDDPTIYAHTLTPTTSQGIVYWSVRLADGLKLI